MSSPGHWGREIGQSFNRKDLKELIKVEMGTERSVRNRREQIAVPIPPLSPFHLMKRGIGFFCGLVTQGGASVGRCALGYK